MLALCYYISSLYWVWKSFLLSLYALLLQHLHSAVHTLVTYILYIQYTLIFIAIFKSRLFNIIVIAHSIEQVFLSICSVSDNCSSCSRSISILFCCELVRSIVKFHSFWYYFGAKILLIESLFIFMNLDLKIDSQFVKIC